jgi:hypothetical protein
MSMFITLTASGRGDWDRRRNNNATFKGYIRKDGKVGTRNHIAVLPSVVCANEVVESIVSQTQMTQASFTTRMLPDPSGPGEDN